jgi:hypothetical protein
MLPLLTYESFVYVPYLYQLTVSTAV